MALVKSGIARVEFCCPGLPMMRWRIKGISSLLRKIAWAGGVAGCRNTRSRRALPAALEPARPASPLRPHCPDTSGEPADVARQAQRAAEQLGPTTRRGRRARAGAGVAAWQAPARHAQRRRSS